MMQVLFLFLVTEFAETRQIVWKQQETPILSVMTASEEIWLTEDMQPRSGHVNIKRANCIHDSAMPTMRWQWHIPFWHKERPAIAIRDETHIPSNWADSVWKCTSDERRERPRPNLSSFLLHSSYTSNIHSNMRQLSWTGFHPSWSTFLPFRKKN